MFWWFKRLYFNANEFVNSHRYLVYFWYIWIIIHPFYTKTNKYLCIQKQMYNETSEIAFDIDNLSR